MIETVEEAGTYWAVVAQLVPVIGLALAIETRGIAQRNVKKKRRWAKKRLRRWGVWVFFTWFALLASFTNALGTLILSPDRALRVGDFAWLFFSLAALLNSLFLLASIPIGAFASAVSGNHLVVSIFFANPWGYFRRTARTLHGYQRELMQLQRDLRSYRIALRIMLAERFIDEFKYDAIRRQVTQHMSNPELTHRRQQEWGLQIIATDKLMRENRSYIERLIAEIAEAERGDDLAMASLKKCRKQLETLDKSQLLQRLESDTQIKSALKEVASIIR